jgi:DNA polymerase/3'-5' exonuclease PolX
MTKQVDRKQDIIDALEVMQKKEYAEKAPFKARAYAKVVKQLKTYDAPIYNMEDLEGVSGIGDRIKEKIAEIIETGKLHQVEEYKKDPVRELTETLLTIYGIGPAKAKELVEVNKITSIDELKTRQDELLNDKQKIGMKYIGEFDIRIPRKEVDRHVTFVKETVASVDPSYIVEASGSYRRGENTSGDVDFLLTHPDGNVNHEENFTKIIELLQKKKYITDILAKGGKKCLAVGKVKRARHFRRIDFMMTERHVFPFALLYFTGSGPFNVAMRNAALAKGYSLSEYGLKNIETGEFVTNVDFNTEEDVFRFLGLKYVAPADRKTSAVSLEEA